MNSTAGQVISCKAAICWSPNNQTIEIIEVSPPKAGEIRIRVIACGICGSDDHILRADQLRASTVKWPTILGHEAGGVVESVGDGVTSVVSGDHVLVVWMPQCDDCELCCGSDTNFCMKGTADAIVEKWTMRDGSCRISFKGQSVYKYLNIGAFSEYIVMPEEQVIKIPNDIPIEEFCLFACGLTTGYGSAVNVAKVKSNHSVAVWGLGTVGLGAIMGAKEMGAQEIIGVDTNENKFALALKLGCTQTINPIKLSKPINDVFQENHSGLNVGIDCVGNIPIIETIMKSVKPWGTVCLVGIPPVKPMQVFPIHFIRGRVLTGADFGGFKGKNAIKYFLERYQNKSINIKDLITQTISLDEINRGFQLLKSGNSIKIIVKIL